MAVSLKDPQDGGIDELSEINVTPFIDVMLVLLIIFMVAAPLSTVDVRWTCRCQRAAAAASRQAGVPDGQAGFDAGARQ